MTSMRTLIMFKKSLANKDQNLKLRKKKEKTTFEDVRIKIVDFSKIVLDADNCDRRRSSLRS